MGRTPAVLFVCVHNGGKSQIAAALLRRAAPEVAVHSAGTDPGPALDALSVDVLGEIGIDISNETPKPIGPQLLEAVDIVITIGREAEVDVPDGVELRNWDTDEPSERGIEGIERTRLVRDDIDRYVRALATEIIGRDARSPSQVR